LTNPPVSGDAVLKSEWGLFMKMSVCLSAIMYGLLVVIAQADGNCVADRICWIDPSWNPETGVNPPCQTRSNPRDQARLRSYDGTLQEAVAMAPSGTYADLCRITRYFVVPRGNSQADGTSWGLWENPANPRYDGRGNAYIAISEEAFGTNYTPYEERLQNLVVRGTAGQYRASQDTNILSVLSIISHELAHLKWYGYPTGPRVSELSCYTAFDASWTSLPNRSWVPFADKGNSRHRNGRVPQPGKNGNATRPQLTQQEVTQIYESGEFISVFAAVSPEEDFVETYKALVLDANLSSYVLRHAGRNYNLKQMLAEVSTDPKGTNRKAFCARSLVGN
jgi:hypothetical protein